MRRGEIDQKIAAVLCGLAILVVAAGQFASRLQVIPPAPVIVPPAPEPQSEPAMVIVTDATGRRITDADLESVAGKMAVGSWRVQAVPKPGDLGWTRTIVVAEAVGPIVPPAPKPPAPPAPTPIPPEPTPPPVADGKRALLIVRETADTTPEMARLITGLRAGPQAAYLQSKGHTLSILDDDNPSPLLSEWRPHFAGMTLPVLFIIDPIGNRLLYKGTIAPTATADEIVAKAREFGG